MNSKIVLKIGLPDWLVSKLAKQAAKEKTPLEEFVAEAFEMEVKVQVPPKNSKKPVLPYRRQAPKKPVISRSG